MEADTLAGNRLGEEHVLGRGDAILEEPVRGDDGLAPAEASPTRGASGTQGAAGSLTRGAIAASTGTLWAQ